MADRITVDPMAIANLLAEFAQSPDPQTRNTAAHITAGLAGILRSDPSFNYRQFVTASVPKYRPKKRKGAHRKVTQ